LALALQVKLCGLELLWLSSRALTAKVKDPGFDPY